MRKTLFRPVGFKEMHLILQTSVFPPRLPHQPIFYPVLTEEYATQIARDWNTTDAASDYCGFVTAFDIDGPYANQFKVHQVGAAHHLELWVPAAELDNFNAHIESPIEVLTAFYGGRFTGLKADQQLLRLRQANAAQLEDEIVEQREAFMLHYPYWLEHDFSPHMTEAQKGRLLQRIVEMWCRLYPHEALLGSACA